MRRQNHQNLDALHLKSNFLKRKVKKLEPNEHALVPRNFPSMHYNEFPELLEYNKQMFLKIK